MVFQDFSRGKTHVFHDLFSVLIVTMDMSMWGVINLDVLVLLHCMPYQKVAAPQNQYSSTLRDATET